VFALDFQFTFSGVLQKRYIKNVKAMIASGADIPVIPDWSMMDKSVVALLKETNPELQLRRRVEFESKLPICVRFIRVNDRYMIANQRFGNWCYEQDSRRAINLIRENNDRLQLQVGAFNVQAVIQETHKAESALMVNDVTMETIKRRETSRTKCMETLDRCIAKLLELCASLGLEKSMLTPLAVGYLNVDDVIATFDVASKFRELGETFRFYYFQ
jgi:hypothetical protein